MERFVYKYKKERTFINSLILYPNRYYIGMSNLGYQTIYHILQNNPYIFCERAFYEEKLEKNYSLENKKSLGEFDYIFVSFSFENDLLNFIKLLKKENIELDCKKRKNPIIIAGGIATPLIAYYLKDIVDLIICGDANIFLPELISFIINNPNDKELLLDYSKNKKNILSYKNFPNEYPNFYVDENILTNFPNHSVIISENTEFSNMGLIEIAKGCLYSCAFCYAGNLNYSYNYFSIDKINNVAQNYLNLTNKIGLIAPTLTNHPEFKSIINHLNNAGFQLSFSAFRIENIDDELLELIIKNENRTLVIAPETASNKLKSIIRKFIPNDIIIDTVRKASLYGIKRIKLYFLVGIPEENEEDINENIRLIKNIRNVSQHYSKNYGYIPEIIVDINPLVPKPFTSFYNYPMDDIKNLKEKILYIKKNIRDLGRVFVYGESPKNSNLQYLISHHKIDLKDLLN